MATQATYTRLRDMTGTTDTDYPDAALDVYLEESQVEDSEGRDPGDDDYVPTYDLHRAAAKIWRDRMAHYARYAFNTQIDMTKSERSQIFENFHRMARYHDMKSKPRMARFEDHLALVADEE